jgi:hypothetical protein
MPRKFIIGFNRYFLFLPLLLLIWRFLYTLPASHSLQASAESSSSQVVPVTNDLRRQESLNSLLMSHQDIHKVYFIFTAPASSSQGNSTEPVIQLSPKELCSIESAMAKLPLSTHFYFFLDPPLSDTLQTLGNYSAASNPVTQLLKPLYDQNRLHLIEIDFYMKSTCSSSQNSKSLIVQKACQWYESGIWKKGFALNNKSNFLRLLILYLHGGLYLDTDIFVLRNIFELHQGQVENESQGLVGLQEPGVVNNAVLQFSPENPFVLLGLQAFFKEFNGEKWGHNGPDRLTDIWAPCLASPSKCEPWLTFYPKEIFYPFSYKDSSVFFGSKDLTYDQVFSKLCQNSYTVHLWNHFSKDMPLAPGTFMWGLASRYCPLTFQHSISNA